MKDSQGHLFDDLLAIQEMHLATWKQFLKSSVYDAVMVYVRGANLPAGTPDQKHRVYRGQDLVQIILSWPTIPSAYVQPVQEESVL